MKYKIGDYVIIIDDYTRCRCIAQYRKGKDLKNEIGKIINIDYKLYEIEILNCPYKKECRHFTMWNYCHEWLAYEFKSLNQLKLKKFIKHGV